MTVFSAHRGYATMFKEHKLTVGLFLPLESYSGAVPNMNVEQQLETAKLADNTGFAALYFRDVLLHVPSFGDVGHIYDPWVLMGLFIASTSRIALATGSIVSTLRHPLHLAKAASSADRLSGQRLVLGLATGDRPSEFSAFNTDINEKAELFREALAVAREVWKRDFPSISTPRVAMSGADVLPKPVLNDIPVLVTGNSRQSLEWIAVHGDGWLYYPRDLKEQEQTVANWRRLTPYFKPFAQSLYIDLAKDPNEAPSPIFLGFKAGRNFVIEYFAALQQIGVNHVGLNLKYATRPAHEIVEELAEFVIPHFSAH